MTETRVPGHPDGPEGKSSRPWRQRQRDFANVLWVSFLTASVATMVFFASVDPEVLSGNNTLGWEISRQSGYALGFFGFWVLTALTGFLTVYLVRTERRARDFPGHRPERSEDRHGRPASGADQEDN